MTEEERNMDLTIAELEQENRLLRARNDRMVSERNAVLEEIAAKIGAMPFGDTAASFAVWIREQKA